MIWINSILKPVTDGATTLSQGGHTHTRSLAHPHILAFRSFKRTNTFRSQPKNMNAVVVADQTTWLDQVVSSASAILGLGDTVAAVSKLARKHSLSALWEVDPCAAPPKSVQRTLLGTAASEDASAAPGSEEDASEDPQESHSVLEVQLKFAMRRHDLERVRVISRQLRCLEGSVQEEEEAHVKRGELRIGDKCFALAKVVEWEWYSARLLRVRSHHPRLQVEYLATLDGQVSQLALPVPRINHLPLEHVCIQRPIVGNGPIHPPTAPCVTVVGV